jgi:hypothetical protein
MRACVAEGAGIVEMVAVLGRILEEEAGFWCGEGCVNVVTKGWSLSI